MTALGDLIAIQMAGAVKSKKAALHKKAPN